MTDPTEKDARRRREKLARESEGRYGALGPAELAAGVSWELDEAGSPLFLGTYSAEGIRRVARAYGLERMLEARGIARFDVELDTSDPFLHVLRLRTDGETFFELRVRLALGRDLGLEGRLAPLTYYVIEWISMENPFASFDGARPPLPGQRHPGLGLGPEVEAVLVLGARRVGAAALLSRPQWFHNAYLYQPRWRFLDPAEDGRFAALCRDLGGRSLALMSWAVHLGCVREGDETLEWAPGPLALPRAREVARHFDSAAYRAVRFAAKAKTRYSVDDERLGALLAERGLRIR